MLRVMSHSVIFCGTPAFAVQSLRSLLDDPAFQVTLVVTRQDKPQGRSMDLTPPPVKLLAAERAVPVFQPANINRELAPYLQEHGIQKPDFLVVVAYGAILSKDTLALPTIAPINVHGSVLPRWRGASPVEHALLAGDAETGVTVQIMAEELDAGPVLSARSVPIGPRETAVTLREKLSRLGAELLVETLHLPLAPVPQPSEGITFCSKLTKQDGHADPATMTAVEIDRRVRALNPWPGVTVEIDGQPLKLLETALEPGKDTTPLSCNDDTTLHLITVLPAGKKPMSGGAWFRGRR